MNVAESADNAAGQLQCRAVTSCEIAFYKENGWVKLKKFIDPAVIDDILDLAVSKMGANGRGNALFGTAIASFNAEFGGGLSDRRIRPLIEALGRNAKSLMDRLSGVGARYYLDHFAAKLPSGQHSDRGGNGPTNFHQDFVAHSVDRTGGMTFWIPLRSYSGQAGTMSFISGSHKLGVMGNYDNYAGGDMRDIYPELRHLAETDPIEYEIGDVTVHDALTVHGAGPNMTDEPRWAYMVLLHPADSHWTGAPMGCTAEEAIDCSDMKPNELLDATRFPVLS